jgi:hypothetical protein
MVPSATKPRRDSAIEEAAPGGHGAENSDAWWLAEWQALACGLHHSDFSSAFLDQSVAARAERQDLAPPGAVYGLSREPHLPGAGLGQNAQRPTACR